MTGRPSPSFVVAVLALVVAAGGTGYAAGQVRSGDIKDNTVASRDVKNNTLTSKDVRAGSLTRSTLDDGCARGESALFGGCVARASSGPTGHQAAIDDCSRRNGRLPTTLELRWIATHEEFAWADTNPSQYEFTGDYTSEGPLTPIAFDKAFNVIGNASAQTFWHHCVTY